MDNRKMIYLDDALEAIRKLPNAGIHWFVSAEAVFNALLKLPPAQPEPCEKDIIGMIKKCTNCPVSECKKAFDIGIDYLRSKTMVQGGKDAVSRQVETISFDDGCYRYGERRTDEAD